MTVQMPSDSENGFQAVPGSTNGRGWFGKDVACWRQYREPVDPPWVLRALIDTDCVYSRDWLADLGCVHRSNWADADETTPEPASQPGLRECSG